MQDLPHLETIRKLRSFISFDMLPAVGDKIFKTVDCFTAVGSISLVHKVRYPLSVPLALLVC